MTNFAGTPRKPSLRETLTTMHRMLRGEISPEAAAELLHAPVERLAIYRDFVRNHVRGLLEKNYTVLARLLPPGDWDAIIDAYFVAHPSLHCELNANAEAFPVFLSEMARAGKYGVTEFHIDLCEVEWLEWVVYIDTVRIPVSGEVATPQLNPTLQITRVRYPVAEFIDAWRASKPAARPTPPDVRENNIVFVWRDPETGGSRFARATDDMLFVFKMLHDGIDTAAAARQSGLTTVEIEKLLALASGRGLAILPKHTG